MYEYLPVTLLGVGVYVIENTQYVGVAARHTQKLHCRGVSAFGWAEVDCSEPRGASSTPIPTRVRFVCGRLSVK
jgi:hypothetical protein